jgi:hypothetical protein
MNKFLSSSLVIGLALALMVNRIPSVSTALAHAPEPNPPVQPHDEGDFQVFLPLVAQQLGPARPPTATPTPKPSVTPPTPTPTVSPTPPAASNAGFFILQDWLSYNAAIAIDLQGGAHLAFYLSDERHDHEKRNQAAYYTYCPPPAASCKDPTRWGGLVQFSSQVGEVQVVATTDNKPRLLVRRNGSRAYEYEYYACNQNCLEGQNWSGLHVTEAAGVEINTALSPQHSFALDSQNRPRFVYSNGWGIGKDTAIYYTACDAADCTQPGSWKEVPIHGPIQYKTVTGDYASLVFDGDKPRVVSRLNLSGLPDGVFYYQCDEDCATSSIYWGYRRIKHPEGKMWANWDLALDTNGLPHLALYEPAPINITVGGKLYYAWCNVACQADVSIPFTMTHVASGEGLNVDLAIDPQGRKHMVYDAGQRAALAELWCEAGADCTQAATWQHRNLETSQQLQAQFAPASPLNCDQENRAWLDAVPKVTFDAQGTMIVGYDIKNVTTCYYQDPNNPGGPLKSKVERLWWAVRLAFFGRA